MRAYEIYEEMRQRNLTTSMRSWSQQWLSRSQNYCATHGSEPLPAETAIELRRRLIAEGHPDLAAKVLLAALGELDQPRRPSRRTR